MGRFLKFIFFSILIVSISFGVYKFGNKYDLNLMYNNIEWSINTKGINGAVAFDFDKKYNLYIAFKDYIKVIRNNDKEEILIEDKTLNIYDVLCYGENIIIATDNRVLMYSIDDKTYTELIKDIPNLGINYKTNITLNDDKLYVTIGSNTNSGVIDDTNKFADKPSFEWILNNVAYGGNYAFLSSGEKVKEGYKIKESTLSNGSIIKYNLKNGELKTYATGLRNVEGLCFDSKENLNAIVGGIEDGGVRPIKDDVDYIYEIKEKAWYGWPDFSGGDPIISPRFSDGTLEISFVIKNHPTEIPLGPKYQHNNLSALRGLAIDYEGRCFPKDTIIFADNKKKCIYMLTEKNTSKVILDLEKNSYVEKIKYFDSSIYVLDSSIGCLYKITCENRQRIFNLPNIIWIFLMIFIVTLLLVIVYKVKMKKSKQ